jgi:large subunit ribosomal protein L28
MARCERCGKGPQFGHNRPFSLKATNRRFNVNIQRISVYEAGQRRSAYLCTRCMRTAAKGKA